MTIVSSDRAVALASVVFLLSALPMLAAPVTVARTTTVPACRLHVDASASAATATGTAAKPYRTIAKAVAAAEDGFVICVAQGTYPEKIKVGTKGFTLAGGFQSGRGFTVRDSAKYVSLAKGSGGAFLSIADPAPTGDQRTVVDGFEITGYSQAILREYWISQHLDITNNFFHDNVCRTEGHAGAGFSLNNVSGSIRGNVFRNNTCGRGGAGFLNDALDENRVTIANNRFEDNHGNEPVISHGGALYLFSHSLSITGNLFTGNTATGWGGGLYVGAFTAGGQHTSARLASNVYRGNAAGGIGGGFFCDDGARCRSDHEIYDGNCGGNIYLDSGPGGSGPTIASFDHLTNVNAKDVGCAAPGSGVIVTKGNTASDRTTITNAIFRGNASKADLATFCDTGCSRVSLTVSWSMVQRSFLDGGFKPTFGPGILAPADPRFVDPAKGDFHLKSVFGHYTRKGLVTDTVSSPALAKGDPAGDTRFNPACAGSRTELGAYGNTREASCVR